MHTQFSNRIHQDQPWNKKGKGTFDVTMAAYVGAEVCELVGLYLLSLLAALPYDKAVPYRDNGLMLLSGRPAGRLKSTWIRIKVYANKKK